MIALFDNFILRAALAGVGVALVAGPLGCFVVWRRMAYFGDTVAHAALLGVALALALEIGVIPAVLAVAAVVALAVARGTGRRYAADTLLGVLAHGGLAIGLDGRRLTEELRSPSVSACASKVSVFPEVRTRVDEILRRLAADYSGGVVCEGRDMATVVFPQADVKVFMQASSSVRAQRRLLQRGEKVTAEGVQAETRRLVARDSADSGREVSPLRKADASIVIDTTELSFEEQVQQILDAAAECLDTP